MFIASHFPDKHLSWYEQALMPTNVCFRVWVSVLHEVLDRNNLRGEN